MTENREHPQLCPRCGRPVPDPVESGSWHRVSQGWLTYRRCGCGSWLLWLNDTLSAATAPPPG